MRRTEGESSMGELPPRTYYMDATRLAKAGRSRQFSAERTTEGAVIRKARAFMGRAVRRVGEKIP